MAVLYGRAGCLHTKNAGFRPGQEGNGGVPGVTSQHKFNQPAKAWARIHGTGGAYGVITTDSKDAWHYEHVWNNGNNGTGKV
jgi:hypothetical protein